MDGNKINEALRDIKKRERAARQKALAEIRAPFDKELAALRAKCEELTGHKFRHKGFNFSGDYQYEECDYCGYTKITEL